MADEIEAVIPGPLGLVVEYGHDLVDGVRPCALLSERSSRIGGKALRTVFVYKGGVVGVLVVRAGGL